MYRSHPERELAYLQRECERVQARLKDAIEHPERYVRSRDHQRVLTTHRNAILRLQDRQEEVQRLIVREETKKARAQFKCPVCGGVKVWLSPRVSEGSLQYSARCEECGHNWVPSAHPIEFRLKDVAIRLLT